MPSELKAGNGTEQKEAKRKNETLNYEVNRKVSKIIEPTGAIKRLSVAVLVDGTYEADSEALRDRRLGIPPKRNMCHGLNRKSRIWSKL